ncbi:MAG: hypothetical protein RSB88_03850, partial [Akkermansia sp.]
VYKGFISALLYSIGEVRKKERDEHPYQLLKGLDAFREHLGGELTILMLHEIGRGVDVHDIDIPLMSTCLDEIVHLGTSPLLT